MKSPRLSPVPEGTRWPSGECVDLAVLPLTEDELAERVGIPLVHGVEDGLGRWGGIGGRLPSGMDVEFVCYAHIPHQVIMRVDKGARYAVAFAEALELVGLSRSDLKHVSPLVDG
jgi:hypothetical protein